MPSPIADYVATSDHVIHPLYRYQPVDAAIHTAALVLPAMGTPAGYYGRLVEGLLGLGWAVAVAEWRGVGSSPLGIGRRGARFGYDTLARLDVPAFAAAARRGWPQARLIAIGHSLGGQVGACAAGDDPALFDGLATVASCTVWWRAWRGAGKAKMLMGSQTIAAITRAAGYWPGSRLGFGGDQPADLMLDWARSARTGRLETARGVDFGARLGSYRGPLLGLGIEDDEFAPPSAVDDLLRRLSSAALTRETVPVAAFGLARVGHFAWARTPGPIVARLAAWAG